MPLTIYIKDLVVAARHGVHQHEKEAPQRFKITVELGVARSQAVVSDDLDDTPDWSQLRNAIVDILQKRSYNLMERLAMEIAAKLLEDKRIDKIAVTIDKLDAFESGVPGVRLEIQR